MGRGQRSVCSASGSPLIISSSLGPSWWRSLQQVYSDKKNKKIKNKNNLFPIQSEKYYHIKNHIFTWEFSLLSIDFFEWLLVFWFMNSDF
jgi:hypothetical protein